MSYPITRYDVGQNAGENGAGNWHGCKSARRRVEETPVAATEASTWRKRNRYLGLLALVPRPLARRRIRFLSESLEAAVEILKSTLSIPQVLRPSVLALGILRRLGRVLVVLAVAVLLHRVHRLQDLGSPKESVAPSHRRILARGLDRVRHRSDHRHVGDVRTKPEIQRNTSRRSYLVARFPSGRWVFVRALNLLQLMVGK